MSTSRPAARARLLLTVGVSMALWVALAGCTSARPAAPDRTMGYQPPKDFVLGPKELKRVVDGLPPSSSQRALLADGKVTRDELELSWTRLRSCLERKGFAVSAPVMNPITNTDYLYTYARKASPSSAATPSATTDSTSGSTSAAGPSDDEIAQECESAYWNPVAQVYAANTPQRMSAELQRFMTNCMGGARLAPAKPASTFDGFVRDASGTVEPARLTQANDCLDRGVPHLYPDLPYYPRP
jgi:hypothetical protein